MAEWLSESIEFQVAVATGYLCTRVITVSARPKFARDFAIQVFVWAVIVQLCTTTAAHFIPSSPYGVDRPLALLIGAVSGFLTAVLWQVIGFRLTIVILRTCRITYEEFRGGAWETIYGREEGVSDLFVHTEDGCVYESNIGELEDDLKDGRVSLADDGIGMHVTNVTHPDNSGLNGDANKNGIITLRSTQYTEVTFIPMSQITRVRVRRVRNGKNVV